MKVTITQEHIDKGVCGKADRCPIALALRGLGWADVVVGVSKVWIGKKQHMMSHEAAAFVEAFDQPKPYAKPCSFELMEVTT